MSAQIIFDDICLRFYFLFILRYTSSIRHRVRPFRLKNFFAYKRNKANLDPFHMCFTISLFSLLFAYFRFKFFASLHYSNFCFEAKQSEAKFKSIFLLFSLFFTFFRFKFFASLRFSNFFRFFRLIFVSLRFFRLIFAYFTFVFASDF